MANYSPVRAFRTGWILFIAMWIAVGSGCGREHSTENLIESQGALQKDDLSDLSENHHRGRRRLDDGVFTDCNDPNSGSPQCIHPTEELLDQMHSHGYPFYVGHAEPAVRFFSDAPNSGNNMRWSLRLPATDPAPTQNGSSVANFELATADWISLLLCDPTSNPFGSCVANSDANNPNSAGAAFLELQFVPPGSTDQSCSNTQWCVFAFAITLRCGEGGVTKFITTNGSPTGPKLLMSNGDALQVTMKDTSSGLSIVIADQTSGTSGSMVLSGANGFTHNTSSSHCSVTTSQSCNDSGGCPTNEQCVCQAPVAFNFHPMYATAAKSHVLTWSNLKVNVGFSPEIGHWELCGDAACTIKPDSSDETSTPNCTTIRGVGGCTDDDTDLDGISFQSKWADGTASHPAPFILGASNNTGVGPLAASPFDATKYVQGYSTIAFNTTEDTSGSFSSAAFYPFYSAAGAGTSCRFNFGNDIPGVTTDDFGGRAQYQPLGSRTTYRNNPCFPGAPAWVAPLVSQPLLLF